VRADGKRDDVGDTTPEVRTRIKFGNGCTKRRVLSNREGFSETELLKASAVLLHGSIVREKSPE
jgi:hypothetical protein